MTSELHRRAKEIFLEACERPADERAALLERLCGDERPLRDEVESLLRFHNAGAGETGGARKTAGLEAGAEAPASIGSYRLLQKLGEGGMGEVYEAEQQRPVRRRVALKIIKWGMDTREVVARFESERQALALMDHPNIAKVLEAGSTDQGRPYFAMELVKGVPITDYCDGNRLATTERLRLFVEVCDAVQHAHQKGVIHRDIKPSNILVTIQDDRAVPKIIDFGVAKATSQRLTEHSVFTQLGQWIGTPEYMSPEQADLTGSGRRHPHRRVLARRGALRAAGRSPAVRLVDAAGGRVRRDAPPDPGGRAAAPEHPGDQPRRDVEGRCGAKENRPPRPGATAAW